jgi:hypothetical protein
MAETENIYDIWWWVSKVIASCETVEHVNAAERLIENYYRMFNDAQLTNKLNAELAYKIGELILKRDEKRLY